MKIGLFFGGKSPEHDVSIITAKEVIKHLVKLEHEIYPIYITKNNEFRFIKNFNDLDLKEFNDVENNLGKILSIKLDNTSVFEFSKVFKSKFKLDLAFPCLHGSYGEDGTIQGLFEMINLDYVGCSLEACSIAMNKITSKRLVRYLGVPTTNFTTNIDNLNDEITNIKLNYPMFVKPPHLGSSIGISKVSNINELNNAYEVAKFYDNQVLIEEGVENVRDLTICVIGNSEITLSQIQESKYSADLFNFDKKYISADKKIIIPAEIGSDKEKLIKDYASKIYRNLNLQGIARIDFLMNDKTGDVYFSEINPLPGTLYMHLWKKSGIEPKDLIVKLIEYAIKRKKDKRNITYSFNSSILSEYKGNKAK